MRRLIGILALVVVSAGCSKREIIHPEPTEEGTISLTPVVNMAEGRSALQLVRGFHQVEQNAWRWTMGKFAITLRPPEGSRQRGAKLFVKFAALETTISRLGPITLTAVHGKQSLGFYTAKAAGQYTFQADVSSEALQEETATFDFVLDKFLPAGTLDGRELGVVVSSIGLEVR
ncbi:MAG: hypothetical protein H7039_17145 [Bryobacteraceae bacterium]|nr:hypothetical protein [Bryobacteraceae bacterium]